jgi:hypothetical protein
MPEQVPMRESPRSNGVNDKLAPVGIEEETDDEEEDNEEGCVVADCHADCRHGIA